MKVRLAIKELAEARGLNQSKLFLAAQVTPQLLNRYWNNNTESVSLKHIAQIAEALSVKPGDLLVAEE